MLYLDNPILVESHIERLDRIAVPIPVSECKVWPDEDLYGSIIATNDEYFVFDDDVVHLENLERYVEDKLGALCMVRK